VVKVKHRFIERNLDAPRVQAPLQRHSVGRCLKLAGGAPQSSASSYSAALREQHDNSS
jgi:hypothetical protein